MTHHFSVMLRRQGRNAKKVIREGNIPGVVYGPGFAPRSVEFSKEAFTPLLQKVGESHIVTLAIDDEHIPVLIHDIARHPVTGAIRHVDFYHITKGHKVQATIPLAFSGVSPGVKEKGGTILTMVREVVVEALPEALPSGFGVHLEMLKEFGDEILVRDLQVPSGVTVITSPDLIVVSLAKPIKQEEVIAKVDEETTPASSEEVKEKERNA